jgi:dinuclear metal center YbgI/SA1388 family protein
MKINEIIQFLESRVPLSLQESYDNCGLLTGDHDWTISGVLLTLDVTSEVVEEAIAENCNMIISHHPLIFKGIKKLTPRQEDTLPLIIAIKNDIAIYAIHTNLDNSLYGLNAHVLEKLDVKNLAILRPGQGMLRKLVTFCPGSHAAMVRDSLFEAGAGHIGNYDCCSFNMMGEGTFRGSEKTNPFVGKPMEIHHEPEIRIEVIYPQYFESKILENLKRTHPYEEVAFDLFPLSNENPLTGAGLIGTLPEPVDEVTFLKKIKDVLKPGVIRYSNLRGKPVSRVAICTGSGSFLIHDALRANADMFITADMKYHDFFHGTGKMVLVDVGHYESEHGVKEWLYAALIEKFPTFAFLISRVDTNPVKYL